MNKLSILQCNCGRFRIRPLIFIVFYSRNIAYCTGISFYYNRLKSEKGELTSFGLLQHQLTMEQRATVTISTDFRCAQLIPCYSDLLIADGVD